MRGTRELATRLNWATFVHPANGELLAHPGVSAHPLPGVGLLWRRGLTWPWDPDLEAEPPPSLSLPLSRGRQQPDLDLAA